MPIDMQKKRIERGTHTQTQARPATHQEMVPSISCRFSVCPRLTFRPQLSPDRTQLLPPSSRKPWTRQLRRKHPTWRSWTRRCTPSGSRWRSSPRRGSPAASSSRPPAARSVNSSQPPRARVLCPYISVLRLPPDLLLMCAAMCRAGQAAVQGPARRRVGAGGGGAGEYGRAHGIGLPPRRGHAAQHQPLPQRRRRRNRPRAGRPRPRRPIHPGPSLIRL
jgi:hypothetical protein